MTQRDPSRDRHLVTTTFILSLKMQCCMRSWNLSLKCFSSGLAYDYESNQYCLTLVNILGCFDLPKMVFLPFTKLYYLLFPYDFYQNVSPHTVFTCYLAQMQNLVRPKICRFLHDGKPLQSRLPVKWKMMIITSNQDGLVCILQIS